MAFGLYPPLQVWRTSSSNSARKPWPPSEEKIAFLPFLEAVGWRGRLNYFVGSWASLGLPRETFKISPSVSLSSSTTRRHLLDFLPSLCTGIGPCLSLVHSASLAIAMPVCSCPPRLLPSYFSRWSLVWFRYPVAFTRWCFGCSRGKQVSILCFYYFPD